MNCKTVVLAVAAIMSLRSDLAAPITCARQAGSVSDVAADVTAGEPDIVCANVAILSGAALLSVAFAPGTFSSVTTVIGFALDTDGNLGAGYPGFGSPPLNSGTDFTGTDFTVSFGSIYGANTSISRYAGSPDSRFLFNGTAPVTYYEDGLQAVVPLELIGGGHGLLNYKAVSARQTSSVGFTPILDIVPDVEYASGVPEPATCTPLAGVVTTLLFVKRRRYQRSRSSRFARPIRE